jgi:hypothetical protein
MEDAEQGDLEDAQGIVLQMLKDLRYGNKPEDSSHLQTMDSALVKILLDLKMLDVSQSCAARSRESVIQGGSVKRAFSPS